MDKIKKVDKIFMLALVVFFGYFYLFKTGYSENIGNYFYYSFSSLNIFHILYQIIVRGTYLIFGIYSLKILGIIFLLGIVILICFRNKNMWETLFILMVSLALFNFSHFFTCFSPHLLALFIFLLIDFVPNPLKWLLFILSFFVALYLPLILFFKLLTKNNLKYLLLLLVIFYGYLIIGKQFSIVNNYYDTLYTYIFIPLIVYFIKFRRDLIKIIYISLSIAVMVIFGGNTIYFISILLFFIIINEIPYRRWLIHFYIFIALLSIVPLVSQRLYNKIYKPIRAISIAYSQVKKIPTLPDSVAVSKTLFITQLKNTNKVSLIKNVIDSNKLIAYKYNIWDPFIANRVDTIPSDLKYFTPIFTFNNIIISTNREFFLNKFAKYINDHTIKQLVIVDPIIFSLINCENKMSLNQFIIEQKNSQVMLNAKFILLPDYLLEHAVRKTILFSIKNRLDIEQWKTVISKEGYTLYQSPYTK